MTKAAESQDLPHADLSNQFLLAMPGGVEGSLAGTVIYVCEHTPRGALGLVINRPTDLTLGALFERIDLKLEIEPEKDNPVFFGGPVQTDRGFVLHAPIGEYSSSIKLGEMALTTSRDVLQAVANGEGPRRLLVTLGYADGAPASWRAKWRPMPGCRSMPVRTSFSMSNPRSVMTPPSSSWG